MAGNDTLAPGAGAGSDPLLDQWRAELPAPPSELVKGIKRGGLGAVASAARVGEGAAGEMGFDRVREYLKGVANSYQAQAARPDLAPRVQTFEDANSLSDYAARTGAVVGENLPNMLATVGAALVGRGVGSKLGGPIASTLGTIGGAAVPSVLQNGGEILDKVGTENFGAVMPSIAAASILDTVGPAIFLDRIAKGFKVGTGMSGLVKQALLGGAIGAASEIPTELAQTELGIMEKTRLVDPTFAASPEAAGERREAGAAAGVVGAIFGGLGGAAARLPGQKPAEPAPTPAAEPPQVEPAPAAPTPSEVFNAEFLPDLVRSRMPQLAGPAPTPGLPAPGAPALLEGPDAPQLLEGPEAMLALPRGTRPSTEQLRAVLQPGAQPTPEGLPPGAVGVPTPSPSVPLLPFRRLDLRGAYEAAVDEGEQASRQAARRGSFTGVDTAPTSAAQIEQSVQALRAQGDLVRLAQAETDVRARISAAEQKQRSGELLTADEIRILRNPGDAISAAIGATGAAPDLLAPATTPTGGPVQVVEGSGRAPRARVTDSGAQDRVTFISNRIDEALTNVLGELVRTKGVTRKGATTIKSFVRGKLRGAFENIASMDEAAARIDETISEALSKTPLRNETDAFRQALLTELNREPQKNVPPADLSPRFEPSDKPIPAVERKPGVQATLFRQLSPMKIDAQAVADRHTKFGGSTTNPFNGETTGRGYAVPQGRELAINGDLTPQQVEQFAVANADALMATNAQLTTARLSDGRTALDVSFVAPTVEEAMAAAREAGVPHIYDVRLGVQIPVGHPVFDSAQAYNLGNGMPPLQTVDYMQIDPERMRLIALAYEKLEKVSQRPEVQASYKALAAETEAQYAQAERAGIRMEPWKTEGQPYANSAEMRRDVFENNHLWVFEGGEPHPFLTAEQNWKFRAIHDLYGHAKTGFEFGARGELNATRAHAQMFSEQAIPALVTETIGQNSWVNFGDANQGLPAAEKAFADQKADLLPEQLWRPLLQEGKDAQEKVYYDFQRAQINRGKEAIKYLNQILGGNEKVEVLQFMAGEGKMYAGRYTPGQLKDVIAFATNSADPTSVAAHEGFHFIENRLLTPAEKRVVSSAVAKGSEMYSRILDAARRYDAANKTTVANEIETNPLEASAYGFEFWRRGELEAPSALARVFQKIRQVMERITNWVRGNGFSSLEDVYDAVDKGHYATQREAKLRVVQQETDEWFQAVEPDVIPGADVTFYKDQGASSQAQGRPHWVRTPADVTRLRTTIKALAMEGERGRKWHERSARAIMAFTRGDFNEAEKLAALVANYSPRNRVGMDLRAAITAYVQHKNGQPIATGGFVTQKQHDRAKDILEGREVSGIKRSSFFKNMMIYLNPSKYPDSVQFSTVDMWIAHAFGYGTKDGKVTKGQYLYADAEIKRLARQLGWPAWEVQAAIWIAIKGRMDSQVVRREMDSIGESEKWFQYTKDPDTGKTTRSVKPQYEQLYTMAWRDLGLSVPVSDEDIDRANYAYDSAFADVGAGKIDMFKTERITEEDLQPFQENFTSVYSEVSKLGRQASLFSRAALVGIEDQMRRGAFDKTAAVRGLAEALDAAELPERNLTTLAGRWSTSGKNVSDAFSRGWRRWLQSGEMTARESAGYANVHNVLTHFQQRYKRLITTAIDDNLSTWMKNKINGTALNNVSKAMLDRTMGGHQKGTPEYNAIIARLSANEKQMFEEATQMVEKTLRAEFEADKQVYARLLGAESQEYIDWEAARGQQVNDLIESGYFPERRYGDHAVNIFVRDPSGRKITIGYELYSTKSEATNRIDGTKGLPGLKELLSQYGEIGIEYGYKYKPEVDGSVSFQRVMELLENQGVELTQNEKERIAKALIAADSTKRNRIFRRENIPGASIDGLRVLSEMAVTTSHKIAYAEFGDAITKARKGEKVDVQWGTDGVPQITKDADVNMWSFDHPEEVGFYRTLADQRVQGVLQPKDRNWSATARTMATLQFLGGSIASALVQLTALPMNTVPWLFQHTDYATANTKTLSGFKRFMQNAGTLGDLKKLQDRSIAMPGIDEVAGLRDALIVAFQDGTTMDTNIFEIMGLARGQQVAIPRRVQLAMDAWMYPFRKAEQANRIATFIAAYEIGQKEKGLSGQELRDFAQSAVYSTQFRYDDVNRPNAANSPLGSMIMTFKTYPIYVTELLRTLAKNDRKAAVAFIGTLWFFAGLEGMPFAEDIEDIIDTVATQVFRKPFNSRRWLRNMAAEYLDILPGLDEGALLFQGSVNMMTEANIAGRVGLGNLLPGTRMFAPDADFKKTVEEIAGPAFAATAGWAAPLHAATSRDPEQVLRSLPILAVQNATKGAYAFDRGAFTDAGGRKLVDASGYSALLQTLGFSSEAVRHAYDVDRSDRAITAFYQQLTKSVSDKIVRGVRDKEPEQVKEAFEFIKSWNSAHPDMPLRINGASVRRDLALGGLTLNERTYRTLPVGLRGTSESRLALQNDD